MLRDVFYYGKKPNVHPREKFAKDLDDARSQSTTEHFWIINEHCDYKGFDWDFDFDFLPDEDVWAEDHINVWPSQHQKDSGTWLCNTDNLEPYTIYRADVDPVLYKNEKHEHWIVNYSIDESKFDFSWHPDPTDPPYIYIWGNQWHSAEVMPTVKFHVPGATQTKYINNNIATLIQRPDLFLNSALYSGFDYSWVPDPNWPPYIYQFGTLLDENDGPRYVVEGNDGTIVHMERSEFVIEEMDFPRYIIKTTLEDLIEQHPDEVFWALNPDLDYTHFDFKWIPNKQNVYHINAFGSKDNIDTQTYFVNSIMWQKGHRDINYIEDKLVELRTNIDVFYVDRNNVESQARFDALKIKYPAIQKTRYLSTWVDTISRCVNKSQSKLCWVLNSELDYSDFDFDFYPSPWQMRMVHVFGTQWSHWGTTFMVNKDYFNEDTKYVKVIEHLPNLNFVKRSKAVATGCIYDVYLIDHGNKETPAIFSALSMKAMPKQVHTIKYNKDYLETFKDLLSVVEDKRENYVWVCSSICDYSGFDFSYICDPFAKEQLHVFPSDKQKFGDTFLIDVNKLKALVSDMETLEDYNKVNFNQHQKVNRLPAPVITVHDDTHCKAIMQDFEFPYAVFQTEDNIDLPAIDIEPMSLWASKNKNITITSTGGTRIIVPREAKDFIKKELYDYPYINKSKTRVQSKPLDIVFLSNGEKGADENYEHLLKVTKGLPNRVVRVDGVNGRVAAYHAAAEASETPWMFTVFAKLRVNEKFDWNWQPDRMQVPKHYIFYATNPVNGLIYGHQAMIAYNKNITLSNMGTGLDFTMDSEHEVFKMNSGVAMYNTDEWSTWRTSFREALKLRNDEEVISKYRLQQWLTVGNGDFAQYSLEGARHAVEYYEEVNGDMDKLKLSYEWAWLRSYFDSKYK